MIKQYYTRWEAAALVVVVVMVAVVGVGVVVMVAALVTDALVMAALSY